MTQEDPEQQDQHEKKEPGPEAGAEAPNEKAELEPVAEVPNEEAGPETGAESAEDSPTATVGSGREQPEQAPAAGTPPAARGGLLSLAAIILAIVAAGTSGYVWWQTMEGRSAAEDSAAKAKDDNKEIRKDVKQLREKLKDSDKSQEDEDQELTNRIDELSGMAPRLQAAEQAIDSLSGSALTARRAWLEAEAEYLMQIANTRLRLAQDVPTSVAALEAADERLRGLNEPRLLAVRDLVATEIQTLRALPELDTQGVALQLGALAAEVDRLPLKNALPEAQQGGAENPEQEAGWDRAKAVVGGAFKDMVSVRKVEDSVVPLLAATDEFLMRRNLELQLLTARLAALKADSENYQQSLRDAERWLTRYFDADDAAVSAAIETVATLETAQVAVDVPDISGSLNLLRQLAVRGE